MAKKNKLTVFQTLERALRGNFTSDQGTVQPHVNSYDMSGANSVLYRTTDKEDYEKAKLELQQNRYLKDRWLKANVDLSVTAFAGLTNVKLMYRDADLMDSFPEIGAALDIVSEESCVFSDTKIKLLNGDTYTVEELYNKGAHNFWVYSVDENGACKPSLVERVIYKGNKPLYQITLDDNTIIKCTEDHKWMLNDCSWAETKDLKAGDSLMSIYDKLDYRGYEKIRSTVETKSVHTHRIVAENLLHSEKEKLSEINNPYQKIVIHHKSFNKLNNDPSELVYMFWNDHQKLHTDLNSERWENEEFSVKMKKIFSDSMKKSWVDNREKYIDACKKKWDNIKATWTKEQFNKTFGRVGEQNGMYGVHRYGKENPNYNHDKNHIEDINELEYVDYIINASHLRDKIAEHFNLTKVSVREYDKYLCEKYGCGNISGLPRIIIKEKFLNNFDESKKYFNDFSIEEIRKKTGLPEDVIYETLNKNGVGIPEKNKKATPNIDLDYYVDLICNSNKKTGFIDYLIETCGITRKKACKINKLICKKYIGFEVCSVKNI